MNEKSYILERIAGGFLILLGGAALIGWLFRISPLVQVLPGLVPMQFNTALCFVLCGAALILASSGARAFALPCLLVVLFLCLTTLAQYAFRIDAGIDRLFVEPHVSVFTAHPGRMSPPTALCFLVVSVALSCSLAGRALAGPMLPAAGGALVVLSLFSIVGFSAVLPDFTPYRWSGMALHTSACFLVLGTVLIAKGRGPGSSFRPIALSSAAMTCLVILIWGLRVERERTLIQREISASAFALASFLESSRPAARTDPGKLLENPPYAQDDFYAIVHETGGGREILRTHPRHYSEAVWAVKRPVDWGDRRLEVSLAPRPEFLRKQLSFLPELDLLVGLVLVILGTTALHLGRTNRERKLALANMNADLEKRVAERTRELEAARIESEASGVRFRSLLAATPDALLFVNEPGAIIMVNPRANDLFGYEGEDLIGRPIEVLMPAEFRDRHRDQRRHFFQKPNTRAMAGGRELRGVRKDGREIPVEITLSPFDFEGETVVCAAVRDIQEKSETRKQVSLLAALVENSQDIIYCCDFDSRIQYINPAGRKALGLEGTESIQDLAIDSVLADRPGGLARNFRSFARAKKVSNRRVFRNRNTGEKIPVETQSFLIGRPDENRPLIGVIARDRREIDRLNTELRRQEAYWRSLVEFSPDHIMVIGPTLKIEYVNWTAHGYKTEDIVGQDLSRSASPAGLEIVRRTLATGEPGAYEERNLAPDGVARWYAVRVNPIRDGDEIRGVVMALTEITENKRLWQELEEQRQALRLSLLRAKRSNQELQQFAYVTSHDLQEPLRGIAGCLQILADRYHDAIDDRGRELIDHAVNAAGRQRKMINDLLDYSRVNTHGKSFQMQCLDRLLDEALDNLQTAIDETNTTVVRGPLPELACDGPQIVRLFQNLVANSIKFRSEAPCRIEIDAEPSDGFCLVRVRDNGIGFDERHRERIFTIFKRLHGPERYPGTGIGLSICKRIVARHGGKIDVRSRPGEGSTFEFSLPLVPASEEHTAEVQNEIVSS